MSLWKLGAAAVLAIWAGVLLAMWARAAGEEPQPDCPDELDPYGDCEFPTWLEEDVA